MTRHPLPKRLYALVVTRLLALLLLLVPAAVQAQLSYSYGVTTATVTGYAGAIPNPLNIPATVTSGGNTYQVTAIGDHAFASSGGVMVVNIPDSVTSIGNQAFWGCSSLTAVTGGNGITTIGWGAFAYSANLSVFTIGSQVTSVGDYAFTGCGLTSVTIPANVSIMGQGVFSSNNSLAAFAVDAANANYSSDAAGVLFNKDQTTLIQYPQAKTGTSYSIPGSVTSIGNDAFNNCSKLTAMTIPGGVTSIGNDAFLGCSGLTGVTIPAHVTSIGDFAFYNCSNLESVSFATPCSLTHIGYGAFQGCTALTGTFNIPGSVTTIGGGAFAACTHMTSSTEDGWSASYSSDGSGVLYNKNQTTLIAYPAGNPATSYAFPGTVTGIGESAFQSCGNLIDVTIPGSVTSIGNSAFGGCASLTTVVIDNGVGSILDGAFNDCTSLTSVTIPASVTSIGQYAFQACGNVNAFFLGAPPSGDSTVFDSDPNATAYYLPQNAVPWGTTYGGVATAPFSDCTFSSDGFSVTITGYVGSGGDVTIPGTILIGGNNQPVTVVGDDAFAGNNTLTSVGIPASVTTLGVNAFAGCTGLSAVYFDGPPPLTADPTAFAGDEATATGYYLPDNSGAWGGTFDGLVTVELPFTYTSDGVSITITGYSGTPPAVLGIPAVIDGLPVTGIGDQAFAGYTGLTGVKFPASVTSIGNQAFANCGPALLYATFPGTPPVQDGSVFAGDPNLIVYDQDPTGWGGTFGGAPVEAIQYTYQDDGSGGYLITGYTGPGGIIAIPATINGHSVTGIGPSAFQGNASLTGVVIPDGVTQIGDNAFYYCTALTSVILPASVSSIGYSAFYDCFNLLAVTIPGNAASGTSIGDYAFYDCYSMVGATLGSGVTSIGYFAFGTCNQISGMNIPASVTSIGEGAFASCTSLMAFAVDAANANYSNDAAGVLFNKPLTALLSYPGGLAGSYTIPDGVATIGDSAFTYCTNLTSVDIPASVTTIGSSAFEECSNLSAVTIPGNVASGTSIGDYAFYACSSMAGVTLGSGVTVIGNYVFANCSLISGMSIPASVTSIGRGVFVGCGSLTAYAVDAANANYSNDAAGALFNKDRTTLVAYPAGRAGSYAIPSGVTTIGDTAFVVTNVTGVSIPASVTSVVSDSFDGCTKLTSITVDGGNPAYSSAGGVLFDKPRTTLILYPGGLSGGYTIPNGVTSIGDGAFRDCALTDVTIPGSVASIGFEAFMYCSALKTVTFSLPSNLTSIGTYAFYDCQVLASVTIPASVTSIGDYVFYYCGGLTRAIFSGNAPTMGAYVFGYTATGFEVDYFSTATGFTTPTWDGYPAVAVTGGSNFQTWLVAKGYAASTDPLTPAAHLGGTGLLMVYALNLDPNQSYPASPLPVAVVAGGLLSYTYYAACPDITYQVEFSPDLAVWSNTGVTLSALDSHNMRTASVPLASGMKFVRLAVSQ